MGQFVDAVGRRLVNQLSVDEFGFLADRQLCGLRQQGRVTLLVNPLLKPMSF